MNESVIFWLVLAIVLGIVESATFSLVSIWGAIAALICALISGISNNAEWIPFVFVATTLILIILTRPLSKRLLNNKAVATNADRIIGANADVIKSILPNSPGQVTIMGQVWTALSDDESDIPEGSKVVVISIEGVKVIVKRV